MGFTGGRGGSGAKPCPASLRSPAMESGHSTTTGTTTMLSAERGVAERGFGRQAGCGKSSARRCRGKRMRGWFDLRDIDLAKLLDVA